MYSFLFKHPCAQNRSISKCISKQSVIIFEINVSVVWGHTVVLSLGGERERRGGGAIFSYQENVERFMESYQVCMARVSRLSRVNVAIN